ncbi:cyclin B1 interacting protein 1, E3 ubiquitin protein ligase [Mortierella sp. AD094]|nr:cyclin B1 interacting protein 1, E3 ubiquitin protein ligase [Mortierella sp. AD094]
MISVIENVIQHGEVGRWKLSIEQQISALTSTIYKESGNLCHELERILHRTGKVDTREILRDAVKRRLLYYQDYELDYAEPVLVEASFARIVSDGLPLKDVKSGVVQVKAKANTTPATLDGRKYSVVGCDAGLRAIRHEYISMSQFLDDYCNVNSVHDSKLVPPFFYPPENPSGLDVVFVLESEDQHYPVFVQSKISGSLDSTEVRHAHQTTCYENIKSHLSLPPSPTNFNSPSLADFCSRDIFFSLLLLPNHDQGRYSLVQPKEAADSNGRTLTRYTIIISKQNMGDLLPITLIDVVESAKDPLKGPIGNEVNKPNGPKKRKVSKMPVNASQAMEDEDDVNKPSSSKKSKPRKPVDVVQVIEDGDDVSNLITRDMRVVGCKKPGQYRDKKKSQFWFTVASVLSGLKPEIIMEICTRAISFWTYQTSQEARYQEMAIKAREDKVNLLERQLQRLTKEFDIEIDALQKDVEQEKRKSADLGEQLDEKFRQLSKLQTLYEREKRRPLFSDEVLQAHQLQERDSLFGSGDSDPSQRSFAYMTAAPAGTLQPLTPHPTAQEEPSMTGSTASVDVNRTRSFVYDQLGKLTAQQPALIHSGSPLQSVFEREPGICEQRSHSGGSINKKMSAWALPGRQLSTEHDRSVGQSVGRNSTLPLIPRMMHREGNSYKASLEGTRSTESLARK